MKRIDSPLNCGFQETKDEYETDLVAQHKKTGGRGPHKNEQINEHDKNTETCVQ